MGIDGVIADDHELVEVGDHGSPERSEIVGMHARLKTPFGARIFPVDICNCLRGVGFHECISLEYYLTNSPDA